VGDEAHPARVALVARVVETRSIRFPLLHRSSVSQRRATRKRFRAPVGARFDRLILSA
jgi:hypothetical protein